MDLPTVRSPIGRTYKFSHGNPFCVNKKEDVDNAFAFAAIPAVTTRAAGFENTYSTKIRSIERKFRTEGYSSLY